MPHAAWPGPVHTPPHEVPSQVAVPPAGTGHAVHKEPQVLTEALLTQVPLQSCCPEGHAHTPFVHALPALQTLPHVPQFVLSVRRFTQLTPHLSPPGPEQSPPQTPLMHVAVPPVGATHAVHDAPQLLTEASLAQVPPQSCCPAGHAHAPFEHVLPPLQTLPHVPQFALSVRPFTQLTPHLSAPAPGHTPPQVLLMHVAVPPTGAVHGVHNRPQLLTEVLLAQTPLQSCWPEGHAQEPLTQVLPPVQALPQVPQFALFEVRSTQVLLQFAVVPGHIGVHVTPLQVADPPTGAAHAAHDDEPQVAVALLETHVPLQSCVPEGHLHWLVLQTFPPVQAVVQLPQCAASLVRSTQESPHSE